MKLIVFNQILLHLIILTVGFDDYDLPIQIPTNEPVNRVNLYCDEEFDAIAKLGVCTISEYYLNHSTKVNYQQDTLHYRDAVKEIKFESCELYYLPNGLFTHFKQVNDLVVSHTKLQTLHRSNFYGGTYLYYFTATHNNLTSIDASVFVDADLSLLDLSYNEINYFDRYALDGAKSLIRLILAYNKLKTLDEDTFEDCENLIDVYLQYNELETIPPKLFSRSGQITTIYLQHNKLKIVEPYTFPSGLANLDISHNQLSSFDGYYFDGLNNLILSNNNLTEFHGRCQRIVADNNNISLISFGHKPTTNQLILSRNNLTDITNITELSTMIILDLSFNNIGRINISTFSKMILMQHLNLENTKLSNLNYGTFTQLRELRTLDISYNNITQLNLDIFTPNLPKLTKFYTDGNNLHEFSDMKKIWIVFPLLKEIGILDNRFNCSYLSNLIAVLDMNNVTVDKTGANATDDTHIAGIRCYMKNEDLLEPIKPVVHLNLTEPTTDILPEQTDREKINILIKMLMKLQQNHSESSQLPDMSKYFSSFDHQISEKNNLEMSLLQSNLLLMKIIVILLCSVVFVYVVFKIVELYNRNRGFFHVSTDPRYYSSTTTMNTLRTSVE